MPPKSNFSHSSSAHAHGERGGGGALLARTLDAMGSRLLRAATVDCSGVKAGLRCGNGGAGRRVQPLRVVGHATDVLTQWGCCGR